METKYQELFPHLNDPEGLEDIIDFGKGRFTTATDQQSVWYSNIHYSKETTND